MFKFVVKRNRKYDQKFSHVKKKLLLLSMGQFYDLTILQPLKLILLKIVAGNIGFSAQVFKLFMVTLIGIYHTE